MSILIAFVLGALFAYLLPGVRGRRAESERRKKALESIGQTLQHLDDDLQSSLTHALDSAQELDRSRRLGPEDRAHANEIKNALTRSLNRFTTALHLSRLESGLSASARQAFDLHALMWGLVLPSQHESSGPARIRVRVDPKVPYRLVGDASSLRLALAALCTTASRPGRSVVVGVSAGRTNKKDIIARFEVEQILLLGESDQPREEDIRLAGRIAVMLGGTLETHRGDEQSGFCVLELPFDVQADAPSAFDDVAGARTLVVSRRASFGDRLTEALSGAGVNMMVVPEPGEAVKALARAIRLSDRVDAIILDAELLGDESEAGQLYEKARSVQTPVYLASEGGATSDGMRARGYDGVLDAGASGEIIARAIHAGASAQQSRISGPLVQVEPWVWRTSAGRSRRRILVVDDNVTNLLIVESILRSAGYEVDVARSGEEALTRLLEGAYRLAILDLHMPGMDGVALLKRYRGMRPRVKIPIAFLTANTSMEATRECSDAGADAFLTKPIVLEDLLKTVEALLKDNEVHWLPGTARGDTEPERPTALVDVEVMRELSQIYRDDASRGVAGVIRAFRAEAEELLEKMTVAVSTKNLPAFRGEAQALSACAVNLGAAALAAASRDASAVGPVEFQRDGTAIVGRLREMFRSTMIVFGELVEKVAP